MRHDPPGLEEKPDDQALAGFSSLMPAREDKPGIVSRLLRLPVTIVSLPFRALKALLGLPARLLGRRREG